MRLPSKITSYSESVISKFPPILLVLENSDIGTVALYEATMKYFNNVEEFLDTLDCLFALRKIRYDTDLRTPFHKIISTGQIEQRFRSN